MIEETFAKICFSVMKEIGVDLENLQSKTPKNFWGKVVDALEKQNQLTERGDKWNSKNASQYWKRNIQTISERIALEFSQERRRLEKSEGQKYVLQDNTYETQTGDPEIINESHGVALSNTSETHCVTLETQEPISDVTQDNTEVTPQIEVQSVTGETHDESDTDTSVTHNTTQVTQEILPDVTQETTVVTQEESPQSNTDVTQDELPKHTETQSVTEELIEQMRAVAKAVYQEMQHTETQSVTDVRPVFKRGETDARSVRLDKKMMQAAIEKAQKERVKTGGTLNGLIELLVWEYLGCPDDFIEK